MRKIVLGAVIALGSMVSPAYADHGGYYDGDGRECRGGGCGNEREESYEGSGCKYLCPSFDDSPVQDSFNICLPGSTCNFDGQRDGEQQQPQPS